MTDTDRRFERLVDSLPVGVLLFADGPRLLYANAAARHLLDADETFETRQAIAPTSDARRPDGSPFPVEEQPLALAFATGHGVRDVVMSVPRGAELRSRLPGQPAGSPKSVGSAATRRWLSVHAAPLSTPDGVVRQVVCTLTDLTSHHDEQERARRKLEAELLQSQKVETVGRLAGGIAHDFNNLLTAILGYARLLQDQIGAESPMRQQVEEIFRAGERAAALTSQLLAFSRKERSSARVRLVEVDDVLRDMERMLIRLIGEDVRLELSLASSPWRTKIDSGQLQQVAMNLVVNAREAMPQGGSLSIRTRYERTPSPQTPQMPPANDGGAIVLEVQDSGIGIDDETQRRLFEPFFTTKGSGTGLGLATVKTLVERGGGSVKVSSKPGEGALFELRFPAHQPAGVDETAPIRALRPSAPARESVLVVEDDSSVRFLVQRTLHDAGYRVTSAANGREALDFLERNSTDIDLILTDVIMPGLSGPQFLERVAALCPSARQLMMSGYTADALRARDSSEMATYSQPLLRKPFTPEALLRAVRGAIEGNASGPIEAPQPS
jgi:two-component system cell cycle sensor histidine kinase/response regulator CckA